LLPLLTDPTAPAGAPSSTSAKPTQAHAVQAKITEPEPPLPERPYQTYYTHCRQGWSDARYALDKRFVRLTLLLDQGDSGQGVRWAAQDRPFHDLQQVLDAVPDQALVLLGAPGSGKSTLLRHYELETAQNQLHASATPPDSGPLTLFASLNSYKPDPDTHALPDPLD
jgi:hypothetical protein